MKNIIDFLSQILPKMKNISLQFVDYLTELKNRKNDEKLERILLAKRSTPIIQSY